MQKMPTSQGVVMAFKSGDRVEFVENWEPYKKGDIAFVRDSPNDRGVVPVTPSKKKSGMRTFVRVNVLKKA